MTARRQRQPRTARFGLIFALIALLLAACAKYEAADRKAAPAVAPELAASAESEAGDRSRSGEGEKDALGGGQAESTRKLIQNAELHLEVAAYADARRAVEAELARAGGYLSSARIDHHDGQVSRAVLVLRIPSTTLKPSLEAYSKLGTVVHETLNTKDITDEYFDLKARLGNARKLEARLLELLASEAKELKDLLEVEKELSRVREKIERFEGKLRLWDKQVDFSTLTLELITRDIYSAGQPRTIGEQIGHTFSRSWEALQKAGRGLLLVLVALLPWAIPLALLGWLGLRFIRWMERRMAAKSEVRRAAYAAHAAGYAQGVVPTGYAQAPTHARPHGAASPAHGAEQPPPSGPSSDEAPQDEEPDSSPSSDE